jgi:hypothetical protein
MTATQPGQHPLVDHLRRRQTTARVGHQDLVRLEQGYSWYGGDHLPVNGGGNRRGSLPCLALFWGGKTGYPALHFGFYRWPGLAERRIEPLLIQGRGCHGMPAF